MELKKENTLVVIAGPTAIGKTALAVKLAKHLDAEIISADSRQFYKEMTIGTAKPSEEEMQGVPHHFVGHISIHEKYNAGKFEEEVMKFLPELFRKNHVVIMVGGSGLFIDAVCKGFDSFEEVDSSIREQVNRDYTEKGLEWLQQKVRERDPVYFEQVDKHNPQRLLRALEVCIATGKPYSSFKTGTKKERPFNIVKILIEDEREKIYERINRRTDEMMARGWLHEAKELFPYRHLNALNTVGYKELFDMIDGKTGPGATIELIKQNTRRYAKRQLTWFRNDPDYISFRPDQEESMIAFVDMVLTNL